MEAEGLKGGGGGDEEEASVEFGGRQVCEEEENGREERVWRRKQLNQASSKHSHGDTSLGFAQRRFLFL